MGSTCLAASVRMAPLVALLICAGGCLSPRRPGRASDTGLCQDLPREYTCRRAGGPITIDGRLDELAWARAPRTEPFVHIEGANKPTPRFKTWAKMLWDDEYFYIGARLEEPHVWATLTQRDAIVFHDNDFEVFIDPNRDSRMYYEIEINAHNTVFDLLLERTYLDGGPARHEWNLAGLQTAVHVRGTLNDPSDHDTGWSVELALPWSSLAQYAGVPCPPHEGDTWWVNFSRVQWRHVVIDGRYHKKPDTADHKKPGSGEDNWVWSPQGAVNMHIPPRWGRVTFSKNPPSTPDPR